MSREIRSTLDILVDAVAVMQIECPVDGNPLSDGNSRENANMSTELPFGVDEAEVKPQVSIQLDILNQRNEAINKLEIEYEEQMHVYSVMVSDANSELSKIENKLGDCVRTAFLYYNALDDLFAAKNQLRDALHSFEHAQSMYLTINEFIDRIEHAKLEYEIGPVWEQLLKSAKAKVKYFGREKVVIDEDVQKWSGAVETIEQDVKEAEKGNARQIRRARPFYDRRYELRRVLNNQVALLNQMKNCITEAKAEYQSALKQLECISNRIHKHRLENNIREVEDNQQDGMVNV